MPGPIKKQVTPKSVSKPKNVSKPNKKLTYRQKISFRARLFVLLFIGIPIGSILYYIYSHSRRKEEEDLPADILHRFAIQNLEQRDAERWRRRDAQVFLEARRAIDISGIPQDVQDALRELYSKTSVEDIEHYCRFIQRKFHPDRIGGDAEKSKIINAECDKKKNKF